MLKKLNAWIHLWLGLVSGIVVFVLSITGCLLVFKQEIRSLSSPWLRVTKEHGQTLLPPSDLYRSVQKTVPDKEIVSVWYHGDDRAAHVSVANFDSLIYVNPYTAELAAIYPRKDFFYFIEQGHTTLWLPASVGRKVVSWATLLFFVLLITGIVLWWPRKWNKRGRKQAFTIQSKASFKRLNYDLHNVLGFYSLVIAAVFAFTGLMMGFAWFSDAVYRIAGGKQIQRAQPATPDAAPAANTVMLEQVDRAWLKGVNEISQHNRQDIIVSFPDEAAEPIYLCVDMYKGTWRDVYLDQYTLQETAVSQLRLKDVDLANWIRRINYALHVGDIGGLATRILYFLASLICASLPVTGFLVWWGKRKKTSVRPVRINAPAKIEIS